MYPISETYERPWTHVLHFQKLSDMEHEHEGEHNPDYDHEAFLGKDDAKTFDQLTPDESKDRLG